MRSPRTRAPARPPRASDRSGRTARACATSSNSLEACPCSSIQCRGPMDVDEIRLNLTDDLLPPRPKRARSSLAREPGVERRHPVERGLILGWRARQAASAYCRKQLVDLVAAGRGHTPQQRLRDERRQRAQRCARHDLGRRAGEAAPEDADASQRRLLFGSQKRPRMIEDRTDAMLPAREVARLGLQEIDVLADLRRRSRTGTGCRSRRPPARSRAACRERVGRWS